MKKYLPSFLMGKTKSTFNFARAINQAYVFPSYLHLQNDPCQHIPLSCMSQEIVEVSISSFIHGMHIPVLLYKCCDAKEKLHDFPVQAAFLNEKQELYPELSAFGWYFSFLKKTPHEILASRKQKFDSELKSEVFHLEILIDTLLIQYKLHFSCKKTLFGLDSCFKTVSSFISHKSSPRLSV